MNGSALGAAVDELLDGDLDAITSAELSLLVEVEVQKRRLAAFDVRLLAQLRDRAVAAEHCRSSLADLLVSLLRVAPGEAKARVLTAEDLGPRTTLTGETLEPVLPRVAAALSAGEVSSAHVSVIGRTLDRLPSATAHEVFPVAEQLLIEAARHEHPRALERTAAMLLARLDPDGQQPHDGDERRREFTLTRHATGWSTARGSLDPATTASLTAVLGTLSAPAPAEDGTPDPRSAAQRRHDGLYEMARRLLLGGDLPAAGGVPATVLVTEEAGDLLPCTDPACEAEVVTVTVSATGAPLALGRTRRLASHAQRLALAVRDGGCCFPDCERPPAWTEAHHVVPWADGGRTDVDNLCSLCAFHHREFARRGWTVHIADDGRAEWIPPDWIDPERNPGATARTIPTCSSSRFLSPDSPCNLRS